MKTFRRILIIASLMILVLLAGLAWWGYEPDIPASEIRRRYAEAPSAFVSLMGMEVHVRDQGNPADSLPIVLLHGTSSSLHTWEPIRERIGPARRVVTMDLPPFGLTGAAPVEQYTYEFYNRFLDSLLDRMAIRQCIIGGNSLGGGICWNYALARPDRVQRLILFDATGYPRKNESGSLGFKLAAIPGVNNLLLWMTPKALVRKSLEQSYSSAERVSEELVSRYHDLILAEGNRRGTLTLFQSPLRPDPDRIREIRVPTLIIWGKDDRLIAWEKASQFGADIAGSQVFVLEESGHVPMEETPDAVAKVLLPFIKY